MRKLTEELDALLASTKGVEQHGNAMRITFHYQRKRYREVLNIPITKANIRHASRLREAILHEIAIGTFDYAKHFPNSKAAKQLAAGQPQRNITISELVARYLAIKNVDLGDHARESYRSKLHGIVRYLGPNRLVSTILPEDIQAWRSHIITTPRPHTGRVLMPRSVNNYMGIAACLFHWALANHYVQQDLCSSLQYVNIERDRPDPISQEEEAALIAATNTPMDAAWITLAIWTGLRTGELCALAWEDIDLAKREMTVRRNITILRQFKMPKTGKERTIALLPPALKALDTLYKITRHKPAHQVTKQLRDRRQIIETCTFVFVPTIKNRNPIQTGCFTVDTLGGKWERLIKRAGIRHRTQYHTRHTFASRMLSAGANPEWVAFYLGHVDSKMVRTVYGAWIPENDGAETARVWHNLSAQFDKVPQKCPKKSR